MRGEQFAASMPPQVPYAGSSNSTHHPGRVCCPPLVGLCSSGADEGNFYALDARNGEALWDFQTGGTIEANPIAFAVDGEQRIAISADRVLYVFGL